MPLRLLPATLSVSEAICCTMVLFGTFPSCIERSSADLLDFFLPFFLPAFFGIMSQNTSEVSHVDISHRKIGSNNDYEDCKRDQIKSRSRQSEPSAILFTSLSRRYARPSSLSRIILRSRHGLERERAFFFSGQYHSGRSKWNGELLDQ